MFNIEKIKEIIKDGKYTLKKVVSPILIATTISLTGCSNSDERFINDFKKNGVILEQSGNCFLVKEFNVEEKNDFIQNSMGVIDDNLKFSTKCVPNEFATYIGEKDIDWQDIKVTLDKTKLSQRDKDTLVKCINNLENNQININLDVLNYNLKNMQIENTVLPGYVTGVALPLEHLVQIDDSQIETLGNEFYQWTLCHEIIGHFSTQAYAENNDGIYCGIEELGFFQTKNGSYAFTKLGDVFVEAVAELITARAMKKNIPEDSIYNQWVYCLQLFMQSLDVTLEDVAHGGTKLLVERMNNIGIEEAYKYLFQMEIIKTYIDSDLASNNLAYNSLQSIIEEYLTELINIMKQNGKTNEEINSIILNYIDLSKESITVSHEENDYRIYYGNNDFYDYISINELKAFVDEYLNQKVKQK